MEFCKKFQSLRKPLKKLEIFITNLHFFLINSFKQILIEVLILTDTMNEPKRNIYDRTFKFYPLDPNER